MRHRRRGRVAAALLVVVALLAASCSSGSSGSDEASPSSTAARDGSVSVEGTTTIEPDPAVTIGTLDNGLTYYVRENQAPGGRAQLRLVVDAGSAEEEADQSGVAHFLEHMLFNGTERFPENELVRTLQGFGIEFGPDINAFTTYDETVYQLAVPTDDDAIVEAGLDVLVDWASAATLAEADVEAEQGVVVEEWRQSTQTVAGLTRAALDEVLLTGTPYAGRSPIGDLDAIQSMDAARLRRFYERWYRPEHMAVIVVGDIDAGDMVDAIEERFAGLEAGGGPDADIEVGAAGESRFTVISDADVAVPAVITLFGSEPVADPSTVEGWRESLVDQLVFDLVTRRLDEDRQRGTLPLVSVDPVSLPIVRSLEVRGVVLGAQEDTAAAGVEATITELGRLARDGVADTELARAVDALRATVETTYAGRDTRQDAEFADACVQHFLRGTAIPDAETAHELGLAVAEDLTAEEVRQAAADTATGSRLGVIGQVPADAELTVEALQAAVDAGRAAAPPPRDDGTVGDGELMQAPAPAAVVSREQVDQIGLEVLELENGATVLVMPSDIARGELSLVAMSPGGLAGYDDDDVWPLRLAADVAQRSGLGDYDAVDLQRLLSGSVVSLSPYIDHNSEGLLGEGSVADLETLFQLVNLAMSRPRLDDSAVTSSLAEQSQLRAAADQVPEVAGALAVTEARYGDDPRFGLIAPQSEIDAFDPTEALALYSERFADAGDFVVVVVGDVDPEEVEDLARRYIGTLPDGGNREPLVDPGPPPPDDVVALDLEVGDDPQANVTFLLGGEIETDQAVRTRADALRLLLESELIDGIREELAATYAPTVSVSSQDPDDLVETYVAIDGEPDRIDEIADAVMAELASLRDDGPDAEAVDRVVAQMRREAELVDNETLWSTLLFWWFHGEGEDDLLHLLDRARFLGEVTPESLQDLARAVLPDDRYVEVIVRPES